jgi:hypothetical protein
MRNNNIVAVPGTPQMPLVNPYSADPPRVHALDDDFRTERPLRHPGPSAPALFSHEFEGAARAVDRCIDIGSRENRKVFLADPFGSAQ